MSPRRATSSVASSGLWIADSKKIKGLIEYKNVGGLLGDDRRLMVAGRNRLT
jgi:hypothetical protein